MGRTLFLQRVLSPIRVVAWQVQAKLVVVVATGFHVLAPSMRAVP
jgi:hypothetical protein